MQTLWVGTRKGLFKVRQDGTGWHIGPPGFPGEPVSQFAVSPHDAACYAALRLGPFGVKLWKSADGASEWKEIAAPAFPPGGSYSSATVTSVPSSPGAVSNRTDPA